MQPVVSRTKIFQRQIPTLVGLAILVIALMVGVLFIGDGLGVFAPRATPQTTPKNIRVSNVTDTGFTVSFLTDEATVGFVKYGTAEDDLDSQSSDDRDQLSGSVGSFTLHHVTVRGLQPATRYYYTLGTGSQAQFDNNGAPFSVSTAKRAGAPAAAKTVYGNVTTQSGAPADGSIVYVNIEGVGDMSSLVKSSGSWAIPLSNARTTDGSNYASITDETLLGITVQGPAEADQSQAVVPVGQAQPVAAISLGQNGAIALASTSPTATPISTVEPIPSLEPLTQPSPTPTSTPFTAGGLSELTSDTLVASNSGSTPAASASAVVNLDDVKAITVDTTQPTITGKAAPNVVVTISVHSDTQIEQQLTANATGEFELDIAALSQELEPGEHSVEYSYVDPATGQTVTKTKTFIVSPQSTPSSQIALASTTGPNTSETTGAQPYGSGNPYPVSTPLSTPTSTASATPTATVSAGKGGTTASRSSQIASGSALPKSGSVSTTWALVFGGIFFLIAGGWSLWISNQLKEETSA